MREGYDRWAATYDATPNPLVALDRRVALPLLGRIADAGFTRLRWREHAGDEALAATVPAAAKYVGRPLLLLIDAERPA